MAQGPGFASLDTSPAWWGKHLAVFDEARGRVVTWGGFQPPSNQWGNETWELDSSAWMRRLHTTSPGQTQGRAMVYDRRRQVVVAYGGLLTIFGPADLRTFEWDGREWRVVTTPTVPPPLYGHCLGWFGSAATGEVVMSGGDVVNSTGGLVGQNTETWSYDGVDWHLRATGQTTLSGATAAWIPSIGRMLQCNVPYGGASLSMRAWDGTSWATMPSSGVIPPGMGQATVVFDDARGQLVLLPIDTAGTGNLDYTWFGTPTPTSIQWSVVSRFDPVTQSVVPPHREGTVSAYDSIRRTVVNLGGRIVGAGTNGMSDTYELEPAGTWRKRALVTTPPAPRVYSEMAYDTTRQKAVLFGGQSNGIVLGDTWTFDGTNWQSHGVDPLVPARRSPAMAHIGSLGLTMLFGGISSTGAPLGDYAFWNGSAWSSTLVFGPRPSARVDAKMAYDSARDRVVLFGGYGTSGSLNDTWEYNPGAATWTQMPLLGSPPARNGHRMVYDSQRQRMVMFGGADANGQFLGDTWSYRPTGWTQLQPPTSPPRRWNPVMAYDPLRNVVVMIGGYGNPQCGNYCATHLDDVWEFDSVTWRQRVAGTPTAAPRGIATPVPVGREGAAMVWDTARLRFLLFGGGGPALPGDSQETWQYRSAVDEYADGQAGGGSIALRCTMAPYAGRDIAFEFGNPSSFGWLAIHLETQPARTHAVDPPTICGSQGWFYGLQPIVTSAGGNPGRVRFGLPTWTLGLGMTFQAIALDAPGMCVRASNPQTVTVQAP